jgi:hypothetical protein
MARSRSLTNLTLDVRVAADIQYATGRHPDSEIWEDINQSICRLYTLLDRLDNQYYNTDYTFATVTNTGSYALPSDFWVLKGVRLYLTPTNSIRATPFMPNEQAWLDNSTEWTTFGLPVYYRLRGSLIVFSPVPKGAYNVTLSYTSAPQRLTQGIDTFDGIAGFERWVVIDAAIKRKQKDSLDAGLLMQEKAELDAWIVSLGNTRDTGEPQYISEAQNQDQWVDGSLRIWR